MIAKSGVSNSPPHVLHEGTVLFSAELEDSFSVFDELTLLCIILPLVLGIKISKIVIFNKLFHLVVQQIHSKNGPSRI